MPATYSSRDWTCTACSHVNFRKRERCERCAANKPRASAAAPPAREPGDWDCPGCGALVFKRRDRCIKCGRARPAPADSDGGAAAASDAGTCVVCLVERRTHVCLPCMHACLCAACAPALAPGTVAGACPMCRTVLTEIKRFYE